MRFFRIAIIEAEWVQPLPASGFKGTYKFQHLQIGRWQRAGGEQAGEQQRTHH